MMDSILKISAGIIVTIILGQVLSKQGKDMTLLLMLAVCSMIFLAAASYFQPVISLLEKLQRVGDLNGQIMKVLMKTLGIGLLTEMMVSVSGDMGYAALGKALQITSTAVILWLAVPLFDELLSLLESVLEAL